MKIISLVLTYSNKQVHKFRSILSVIKVYKYIFIMTLKKKMMKKHNICSILETCFQVHKRAGN